MIFAPIERSGRRPIRRGNIPEEKRMKNGVKLEFGCGETPRKPDFLGVDIRPSPSVTYVCIAWEIGRFFSGNSVQEIY